MSTMKRVLTFALALALLFTLAACGGAGGTSTPAGSGDAGSSDAPAGSTPAAGDDGPIKVAILFNQLGDLNFNDQGFDGITLAKDKLGIEFDYVEAPTTTETETQLDIFANTGEYALIMTMGAYHMDIVEKTAQEYPEQRFSMIDSDISKGLDNVHAVAPNPPEWTFLAGVIAGLVTQDDRMEFANSDNVVAFAGGADNPISRAGACGFLAGAKYINPTVELIYTIVGDYNDPNKAKEIAMTSFERGADVIGVNCGSSAIGVRNAAEEMGRYFCGTTMPMVSQTNSLLTARTMYDTLVYQEVEALVNGTWEAGSTKKGIADGTCVLDFSETDVVVPDDIMAIVDEIRQMIIDGELTLPSDPDDVEEWAKSNTYPGLDG